MNDNRGAATIQAAFDRAKAEDRAALIIYFTAGFPDGSSSRACFEAAVDAGADILEFGLPFSDPMMDGPVIQAANQQVLEAGFRIDDQLALIASLRHLDAAKVIMTYVTIADTRGYARFADELAAAGVSGVIIADLPVAEASPWLKEADRAGLATIFLASSVSTDTRLDDIASTSRGWIYATGLLGVTGVNNVAHEVTHGLVQRLRERTQQPIAVGIGVKDRASAAQVAAYADGVIVGSSVVRAAGAGEPQSAPDRVYELVRELRRGVDRRESPPNR